MFLKKYYKNLIGEEVKRNSFGIIKEKVFSVGWIVLEQEINLFFEEPISVFFLEKDGLVIITSIVNRTRFFVYDSLGVLLKRIDMPLDESYLFMYPIRNKEDHLTGFVISNNIEDYQVEFDVDLLRPGKIKKIKV